MNPDISAQLDQAFEVKAVRSALYGVTNAEPFWPKLTLESRALSPAPYVIKLGLTIGKIKWYRNWDKSAWQCYVSYKGHTYVVSDWKNSAWSISTDSDTEGARRGAKELKRKVAKAAAIMDKVVQAYARDRVNAGEYFLYNNYWKTRSAYVHFRGQLDTLVKEKQERKETRAKPVVLEGLADLLNEGISFDTRIAFTGYAMVGLYYSSLEVLFDVMFAFGERTVDYLEFRELSWAERFKRVLPPDSSNEIRSFYQRLLLTKRNFRDKVFHGMGGDESLLVPLPGAGLVPISSETLTSSITYQMTTMDAEPSKDAGALFDEFDDWIDATLPYCNCVAYARMAYTIPLYSETLDRTKEALKKSALEFQEWLEHEIMIEERLREQW